MMAIEQLPNLGPKSSAWLRHAGIETVQQLRELGPVLAYRLVKESQPAASLNLLWSLAAGLEGLDWRELSESSKLALQQQLAALDTSDRPQVR